MTSGHWRARDSFRERGYHVRFVMYKYHHGNSTGDNSKATELSTACQEHLGLIHFIPRMTCVVVASIIPTLQRWELEPSGLSNLPNVAGPRLGCSGGSAGKGACQEAPVMARAR